MRCRLKVILAERNLKQNWLLEHGVELSVGQLSLVVNGKSMPTLKVALQIARALQLHVDDIWVLDE